MASPVPAAYRCIHFYLLFYDIYNGHLNINYVNQDQSVLNIKENYSNLNRKNNSYFFIKNRSLYDRKKLHNYKLIINASSVNFNIDEELEEYYQTLAFSIIINKDSNSSPIIEKFLPSFEKFPTLSWKVLNSFALMADYNGNKSIAEKFYERSSRLADSLTIPYAVSLAYELLRNSIAEKNNIITFLKQNLIENKLSIEDKQYYNNYLINAVNTQADGNNFQHDQTLFNLQF